MKIRLAGTASESIVDGPGIRFTIFTQGCPHNCEGCHNPQTHDFNGGHDGDTDELIEKIMDNPLLDGVTFSGGEPFCQPEPLAIIGETVKRNSMNVFCYSGYLFEALYEKAKTDEATKRLLDCIDVLIDGPFVLAQKSYELKFKGSANQRILDIKESMKQGKAVEAKLD